MLESSLYCDAFSSRERTFRAFRFSNQWFSVNAGSAAARGIGPAQRQMVCTHPLCAFINFCVWVARSIRARAMGKCRERTIFAWVSKDWRSPLNHGEYNRGGEGTINNPLADGPHPQLMCWQERQLCGGPRSNRGWVMTALP